MHHVNVHVDSCCCNCDGFVVAAAVPLFMLLPLLNSTHVELPNPYQKIPEKQR